MAQATTTDIDRVRLLIGDPVGGDELLSDEQIALLLEDNGLNRLAAAADAADAIAAVYARRVDVRVGILSSSDSQLSSQFRQLAKDLRARADKLAGGGGVPYAGGLTLADRETRRLDDTLARPAFVRDPVTAYRNEERC